MVWVWSSQILDLTSWVLFCALWQCWALVYTGQKCMQLYIQLFWTLAHFIRNATVCKYLSSKFLAFMLCTNNQVGLFIFVTCTAHAVLCNYNMALIIAAKHFSIICMEAWLVCNGVSIINVHIWTCVQLFIPFAKVFQRHMCIESNPLCHLASSHKCSFMFISSSSLSFLSLSLHPHAKCKMSWGSKTLSVQG